MRVTKKNSIKAYKVFNSSWTCKHFQYEVGKTYHHKGEVIPCKRGFHCCENISDCFNYYAFTSENKVAEVRIWGTVVRKDDKFTASNIEIVKELTWYEVLDLCNEGKNNTGRNNTGRGNTGSDNSGDWNPGHYNVGHRNSGSCNNGSNNSGQYNLGYANSGDHNCGSGNTGEHNSSYKNSGNHNAGCHNAGSRNSGNHNSGSWNKGDRNSGFFNTSAQNKFFCFNKITDKKDINFPCFLYFSLTEWVPAAYMTDEEKAEFPSYKRTGGYLRKKDYKKAFRESFLKAKKREDWPEQLELLKEIPNFDAEIFYEISGIRPKELV